MLSFSDAIDRISICRFVLSLTIPQCCHFGAPRTSAVAVSASCNAKHNPGSRLSARNQPSSNQVVSYSLHGVVSAILPSFVGVVTGGTVETRQHAEPLQSCFYINCDFVSSPQGGFTSDI